MQFTDRDVSTKRTFENGETEKIQFKVPCPQYESIEEFVEAASGKEEALRFVNGAVATAAVNGARQYARTAADNVKNEEIFRRGSEIAKGYTPSGRERGPSNKARVAEHKALMDALNSDNPPSMEELLAMAQQYK